jgi:hypothetical protein
MAVIREITEFAMVTVACPAIAGILVSPMIVHISLSAATVWLLGAHFPRAGNLLLLALSTLNFSTENGARIVGVLAFGVYAVCCLGTFRYGAGMLARADQEPC